MSTENAEDTGIEIEDELDEGRTGDAGDEGHEASTKVDSELEDAVDDDEREAIRERRRKEKRNRTQRQKDKVDSLERAVAALTAQNQTLHQQVGSIQDANVGSQLAQVDGLIQQANRAADHYKNIIAEATARQDGRTVAEATEYMIASRNRASELSTFKDNAVRATNAPKPLNPALVSRSQSFLGKNTWYGGPQSNDPDSKVLTAIDNSLTAEGWDATTDNYWNELETRARKYLPHRIGAQQRTRADSGESNSSPVPGGSQSSTNSPGASKTFKLSPDRVKAIKDAGMWDDSSARDKMIQSYRKFDNQNRRS